MKKIFIILTVVFFSSSVSAVNMNSIYLPNHAEQDFNSVRHLVTITSLTQRITEDERAGASYFVNPLRNYDRALRSIDTDRVDPIRAKAIRRLENFINQTVTRANQTGVWPIYGNCKKLNHFLSQSTFFCTNK